MLIIFMNLLANLINQLCKVMNNKTQVFKIYGDNILECEEALRLITSSLEMDLIPVDSQLFVPSFQLVKDGHTQYEIRLFPGYDRWNYDVKKVMNAMGARLREATDAVITKVEEINGKVSETPILAFEFCGALPAGNNAWQRSGRAISCAQSHIPYLYFAELGGVELNSERVVKASRFPNPIVPFAYLSLGKTYDSVTLPIYQPSPSITLPLFNTFKQYFAGKEVNDYIKSVLLGKINKDAQNIIEKKALKLTTFLASKRKAADGILSPIEWEQLSEIHESQDIANWLLKKGMSWRKKVSIPTTQTFIDLLSTISSLNVSAVCSKEMPFCLLSTEQRRILAKKVQVIYKNKLNKEFISWLGGDSKPLFIAWVAGFKPRGDDSRPDRGLVPLLRMVVGEDGVDVLTVVYGPCKKAMLSKLEQDMWVLAKENGLWQSVLNYSNGLIVDTKTSESLSSYGILVTEKPPLPSLERLLEPPTSMNPTKFGEHDVDTVLHELFYLHKDEMCFEGLCNPPGGNLSGISLYNFNNGMETRWVSLPRVSGKEAKRPDHLFQIMKSKEESIILTVESKDTSSSVEENIGNRLKKYILELIKVGPNIFRTKENTDWQGYAEDYLAPKVDIVSVAAFRLVNETELKLVSKKSAADCSFGVEFRERGSVILHVLLNEKCKWLGDFLIGRSKHFNGWLEVQIH